MLPVEHQVRGAGDSKDAFEVSLSRRQTEQIKRNDQVIELEG